MGVSSSNQASALSKSMRTRPARGAAGPARVGEKERTLEVDFVPTVRDSWWARMVLSSEGEW